MRRYLNIFRALALFSFFLVFNSCDQPTQSTAPAQEESNSQWIDPSKLQAGPIIHESLPPELIERIKIVHQTFWDVDGTSLEKWIEDFQRDGNPESNVKIWEDMKVAYEAFCEGRDLSLETRKEVFKVVLFRSMASPEDVLARIELTIISKEDARKIMELYPSAPIPIDVIQSAP